MKMQANVVWSDAPIGSETLSDSMGGVRIEVSRQLPDITKEYIVRQKKKYITKMSDTLIYS